MTHRLPFRKSYRPRVTLISTVVMSVLAATLSACSGSNDSDNVNGEAKVNDTSAAHAGHDSAGGHSDAGAHTHTTRLEFSSEPTAIEPGKAATWRLNIVDAKTGEPVPEFALSHEKLMHLIVVSTDLSWFNHIHPEFKGNGEFVVTTILPRAGSYKLYADYVPKGKSQEVAQHEFATGGDQPTPTMILPVADTLGDGGWMLRSTVARPEGEPEATGGASYQVAMMPMPSKIIAGKDVMLHFQVRDSKGKPVTGLERYLGAKGHAVLLSSDTKTYLHTHPMGTKMEGMDHGAMGHGGGASGDSSAGGGSSKKEDGGSDVIFHTNFPSAGFYKVWGQFQHKGKIVTAAFVLLVS